MKIEIDTVNGTVCRDSVLGAVLATYRLETKRGWNFGRKTYCRELTGRIVVSFPQHDNAYCVCEDWAEVRDEVSRIFDTAACVDAVVQ